MICIKEEAEEEEVMATLLLDCKLEQGHHPETEVRLAGICLEEENCAPAPTSSHSAFILQAHGSDAEQPGLSANQSNPVFTFSSTGANTCECITVMQSQS